MMATTTFMTQLNDELAKVKPAKGSNTNVVQGETVVPLEEYRAGTSTYKDAAHFNLMARVAKPLTDEEIRSLGSYVQGLHARASATPATGSR